MTTLRLAAILAALVQLSLLAPGEASAQQASSFTSLKTAYANENLALGMTAGRQKQDALRQYGKALDGLLTALKQKGDLNAYLVVEAEKKRLSAQGRAPDGKDAAPVIADALNAYLTAVGDADAELKRQTAIARRKYVADLDSLITQLMQADKVEEAKAVKAERDKEASALPDPESAKPGQPPAEPRAPGAPAQGGRRLVLWNTHNGERNDCGTLLCHVTLFQDSTPVWSRRDVKMPWTPDVDERLAFDLPPELAFDKVRVDVREIGQWGGGLTEIQVFEKSGRNIAGGCTATASAHYSWEGTHYSPDRVTDGITSSATKGVGYWMLPRGQLGWIEVDLTDSRKSAKRGIPKGAKAFQGSHYLFVAERVTWREAMAACEKMGGHLATVSNRRENEFIFKLLDGRSGWIGCTDEERDGEWKWVTGERVTYEDWFDDVRTAAWGAGADNQAEDYGLFGTPKWRDARNDATSRVDGYVCEWDR